MTSIASATHFRQRVIRYAENHGVTAAGIRRRVSRNAIYEWRAKYDGCWKTLVDKSHRPHSHSKQHSVAEKEMILRSCARNKDDMILLWGTLRKKGYTRCYYSLVRVVNKWVVGRDTGKQKAISVSKSKLSGTEGAGRCKVCTELLCQQRREVLPVHGNR